MKKGIKGLVVQLVRIHACHPVESNGTGSSTIQSASKTLKKQNEHGLVVQLVRIHACHPVESNGTGSSPDQSA
ncbi:MAG: hypothetical protein IPG18_00730 [Saprospiraceae bacterium]|nr:hypothetical protein [Saprospiraceae bacterium]